MNEVRRKRLIVMTDDELVGRDLTMRDLVRVYLPLASDGDADFILWEMTAFPCNGIAGLREQLAELAAICAPVRKRGWIRKLGRESDRIYAEINRLCRELYSAEAPPAADAVDPPVTDTGKPPTRDKESPTA